MKKITKLLVASAIVTSGAMAANAVFALDQGLYIVPMVGYHHTDDERPFNGSKGYDDDLTYGLGVGYQVNPRMGVELQYNYTDAEFDNGRVAAAAHEAKFENIHADAVVSIPELNFWRVEPYVVAGVGYNHVNFDGIKMDDEDETLVNAGFGAQVKFTDRLSLRTDARSFYSLDNETWDAMANVGLNVLLWKASKPAEPVVEQPVAAAPAVDTDGDGVIDSLDKCPDTAPGAKVDANGCYLELSETKTFTMDVNFGFDSTALKQESLAEVQELADFMKQYPMSKVVLEGHTDSTGSGKYNQALSERRATSVAKALVSHFGIDAARISTVGYGESKPVASNATKEGRAQNRRTVGNVQATVVTTETTTK